MRAPWDRQPRCGSQVESAGGSVALGALVDGLRLVPVAAVRVPAARRSLVRVEELCHEIATLGLVAQVPEEHARDFAERLLESEPFAGPRSHLLATGGQILLQRLGITRQLAAKLLDLAT